MKYQARNNQSGHVLITLLVFMVMTITITGAAITMTIVNTQTISKYKAGQEAFRIAENAADNAMLQLLRNPTYSGETIESDLGTATITISGTTTKTITSVGQVGQAMRTIEVVANHSGGTLTVTSWGEIY